MPFLLEPSPAETAAARAKEAEEQAALPYKWTQTIGELDLSFTVPGNYKSRDLVIEIKKEKLVAGVKGQDPIISVHQTPVTPITPIPQKNKSHPIAMFPVSPIQWKKLLYDQP